MYTQTSYGCGHTPPFTANILHCDKDPNWNAAPLQILLPMPWIQVYLVTSFGPRRPCLLAIWLLRLAPILSKRSHSAL